MTNTHIKKTTLVATLVTAAAFFSTTATAAEYVPYQGKTTAPAQSSAKSPHENHCRLALEHAESAAIHGKAGHPDILSEHAIVALEHAQAAEKIMQGVAKEHLGKTVEHLHQAIEHGKLGHADVATDHVGQAIAHIRAAKSE